MDVIYTENINYSRHYVDSRTGVAYPSVTSITSVEPKPAVESWKQGLIAESALDSLDFIARLDRKAAIQYLKSAPRRNTEAADKGTEAHNIFERMVLGEHVPTVEIPERVRIHAEYFDRWLQAAAPTNVIAEQIAWSNTNGYAGSFDLIADFRIGEGPHGFPVLDPHGELCTLVVDYKTGKSTYPSVGRQLAAYAYADQILTPDGEEIPFPEIHGGAVLHATEKGIVMLPARIGSDVFGDFLNDLVYFKALKARPELEKTILGTAYYKDKPRQTGGERRS